LSSYIWTIFLDLRAGSVRPTFGGNRLISSASARYPRVPMRDSRSWFSHSRVASCSATYTNRPAFRQFSCFEWVLGH